MAVTKANCAVRMSYYESLLMVLVIFKLSVVGVLVLSWAIPNVQLRVLMYKKWLAVPANVRSPNARRRVRPGSAAAAAAASNRARLRVDWIRVFKIVSMVLFIAYPSVSMKVFRIFNCIKVDGHWWLSADMRLQCFTQEWYGFAVYGTCAHAFSSAGVLRAGLHRRSDLAVAMVVGMAAWTLTRCYHCPKSRVNNGVGVLMLIVYVIGLPAGILFILYRNRKTLYGPDSRRTQRRYGFLYDGYGETAWWWEVEELIRKLLLTSVVVLMNTNNPLQVHRLCFTVEVWARVHAPLRPRCCSARLASHWVDG